VEANASKESRIPREQLAEATQVHHSVRQYLQELEQQNPAEEPVHEQDQVSTTDPDSTYATKGGTPARLGHYDNDHRLFQHPRLFSTVRNESLHWARFVLERYHSTAMKIAYRLRDNAKHIAQVQKATLTTDDFGIEPTDGLFGSAEW
jgi:hypothetical protein